MSAADPAARTVRAAIGTSLIGARGATAEDQAAIDDTVAGPCAIGAWTKSECAAHRDKTRPLVKGK